MTFDYGNPEVGRAGVATVEAIYAAFARRDLDAALAHMTPDVEFWPSGTARLLGRTEPYRGHDGVRRYFADVSVTWEDLVLEADDFRATGNSVVVFGKVHGRVGGEPLHRRAVWLWRLRDGLAVSMRADDVGTA